MTALPALDPLTTSSSKPMLSHALTERGTRLHIVGIGGAGMSAIARILLDCGAIVSGSDRGSSAVTAALIRDGATVFEGQSAENVPTDTQFMLISSAVKDDNPEVVAAHRLNIPVIKRREAFPYLLPDQPQIAIAGTHGKTTTTALVTHLLRETGRDPSYIVGGVMLNSGANAHAGTGGNFVIEADEYDYMYWGLSPRVAVITNIEHDHPDMFPTLDDVLNAFRGFIARLPDDGLLIACADDPLAAQLAKERSDAGKPVQLYGLDYAFSDWWGSIDEADDPLYTYFGVQHKSDSGREYEQIKSALLGNHNVLNALAALAAVQAVGVSLAEAAPHFASFLGAGRRFEKIGEFNGAAILSDYGHHPTAIKATLQAMRARYPKQELWAVWQPHTYSRTRLLSDEFAHAFGSADHVLVTNIYAARETPMDGDPDDEYMSALIWEAGHPDVRHSGDLEQTAEMLRAELGEEDAVIIFSAGDAPKIVEYLLTI